MEYDTEKTGIQPTRRLYQKVLEDGLNVTKKQVKEWLKIQDTYTRYKSIIRKHMFTILVNKYRWI